MTQLTENEKKARKIIVQEVDNAMMLLQNHLQTFCNNQKAESVPMNYIRSSIKIFLDGYHKGASK